MFKWAGGFSNYLITSTAWALTIQNSMGAGLVSHHRCDLLGQPSHFQCGGGGMETGEPLSGWGPQEIPTTMIYVSILQSIWQSGYLLVECQPS